MGCILLDNYNPFSKREDIVSNLYFSNTLHSRPKHQEFIRPLPLLSGVLLRLSVVVAGRQCERLIEGGVGEGVCGEAMNTQVAGYSTHTITV
jgi:hypothetical protein